MDQWPLEPGLVLEALLKVFAIVGVLVVFFWMICVVLLGDEDD